MLLIKNSTVYKKFPFPVHSEGLFELEALSGQKSGTSYKETVRYQCPPLMGVFCKREVTYQREIIYQNLRQHFHNHRG